MHHHECQNKKVSGDDEETADDQNSNWSRKNCIKYHLSLQTTKKAYRDIFRYKVAMNHGGNSRSMKLTYIERADYLC